MNYQNALSVAISAIADAEREECARICGDLVKHGPTTEAQKRYNEAYKVCQEAILRRKHTSLNEIAEID